MFGKWIILPKAWQAQHQSRVMLVGRDGEEKTISVIDTRTKLSVPHHLTQLLRPGQMLCKKMLGQSEPLFQRGQSACKWQLGRVSSDWHTVNALPNEASYTYKDQHIRHIYI